MFKYLIKVQSLGLMYGSAGGFLSPENLVGRSRAKFPPDAATLSGLFFSHNKVNNFIEHKKLRQELYVAGPFWAKESRPQFFYLPLPWTKIIGEKKTDEWKIETNQWKRSNQEAEADYSWQRINSWNKPLQTLKEKDKTATSPWKFVSMLHPKMQKNERHVELEDGLFLEYAVQMSDEDCLIYLSTYALPEGWYRFGGENHLVEITSIELTENDDIIKLLKQPIQKAFALICPAIWGSNRLSYRYPQHSDFPPVEQMLTDRAIPYRFRVGQIGEKNPQASDSQHLRTGRLGRGRYAVSAGSVYVLEKPVNKSWWDWPEDWFPTEGFSFKKVGAGLCLPITIEGVN